MATINEIRRITERSERLVREYIALFYKLKDDDCFAERLKDVLERYQGEKKGLSGQGGVVKMRVMDRYGSGYTDEYVKGEVESYLERQDSGLGSGRIPDDIGEKGS